MTRSELIEKIRALSDEEVERVGPYIEADLDALGSLSELHEQIERGRESARTEPLRDHADVLRRGQELLDEGS